MLAESPSGTFLATILSAVLFLGSAVSAAPDPGLVLASGKQTAYVVTVAASAAASERNAATELAAYLSKATGATFTVGVPGPGQPRIAVGPDAALQVIPELDLRRSRLGQDGYVVQTHGSDLVLSGATGSVRGTLYAVYDFLESEVGVRWWSSTEERVPQTDELRVGVLDRTVIPVFPYRDILYTDMQGKREYGGPEVPLNMDRVRFAVRQRVNGHCSHITPEWGGYLELIGWCHTFYPLMPPERYFAEHPDWYSEANGKRFHEHGQLCMTNEDMLAELTRNVLAACRAKPSAGIVSVSQNDHIGNCQCARCRELDAAEGSPSGSLLYGVNRVAEAVEKEFPDFLVETLAYQYTRRPPRTIRPRHNVIIRLSVIERSGVQPLTHKRNEALLADLKTWSAVAPNLMLWDYTDEITCSLRPHVSDHVYGPDFRIYAANNVKGVFCEGDDRTVPLGFDELRYYIMAKGLWNPDVDTATLADEFIHGYYGAAAPAVSELREIQRMACADTYVNGNFGGSDAHWLNLETMNLLSATMGRAVAMAKGDAIVLRRLARLQVQFDHQWLIGYARYQRQARYGEFEYHGPADVMELAASIGADCRASGVTELSWVQYVPVEGHLSRILDRALAQLQDLDHPPPFPARFVNIAADRIVDIQEADFGIATEISAPPDSAKRVEDSRASNGRAIWLDPAIPHWAAQIKTVGHLGMKGDWHAYAIARVEPAAEHGVALVGGVWDQKLGKSQWDLCVQLDPKDQPTQPDDALPAGPLHPVDEDLRDGNYHVLDLGVHDFGSDQLYIWFGTTGGVSLSTVKAIYIDRVLFVRE